MSEPALAQNVRNLLDRHIFSVSQLETLLLLRKFSGRRWLVRDVANELHTNDTAALQMLTQLAVQGLILKCDEEQRLQFEYQAKDHSLESDIEALAKAYKDMRMRVVDRIYQKPNPYTSFQDIADSFLFTKED